MDRSSQEREPAPGPFDNREPGPDEAGAPEPSRDAAVDAFARAFGRHESSDETEDGPYAAPGSGGSRGPFEAEDPLAGPTVGRNVAPNPFASPTEERDVDAFGRGRSDPESEPGSSSNAAEGLDPSSPNAFDRFSDLFARPPAPEDPFARPGTAGIAAEPTTGGLAGPDTPGDGLEALASVFARPDADASAAVVSAPSSDATDAAPSLSFVGGGSVSLRASGRARSAYALGGGSQAPYRQTDRAATPYEVDRASPGPFGASGNVARRIEQFLGSTRPTSGEVIDGAA
ncbi:MAG: hypothetical protein B7733_25055 [Myxococcales bacterium FL481]|nr:MAG: hypothetical protein B7733_25055 [Myxococcales bacterium FL481]